MIFLQKLTDRLLPSCGRREAEIFLQKPDRPHAILPVAGGEPCYFCKNLTDLMLSFLWQAGSHDIFAKTDRPLAPFLWQAGSRDIFAKT
jgi:hypothetical protein